MVHIKKITTKGFKSYGNRRISVKLSPNFTCIVGPNGSGKSNVIDAVSFVLGRLSTKSMRASVLADLIFTGSKNMNPAKYAEVSIYLDNTDGELPFERKEVIISRNVDMSGKSVYRVNRKRETRTYVLDILSQVGIFPEGHNIIMQGDITRFIKMSPWERRGVIEEISGIAEYQERKDRGDRELNKAEDNIARVELVLNEVEKQMNRLEVEKTNALRYKSLKEEIYSCKGWLYKGELQNAKQLLKDTVKDIEKNKEEIAKNNQKITDIKNDIEQKDENFDLINSEIEKLGEEKHVSITKEIERLKGEIRTIEQGLTFIKNQKQQLQTEKERNEIKLKENRNKVTAASEKIETLHNKKKELKTHILDLKKEYQDHVSVLSETGLENLEKISHELDEKKNTFFSLEAQLNVLENDIANLKESNNELETELQELYSENDSVLKEISQLETELADTQKDIAQTTSEYNNLKQERETIKHKLDEIETNFLKKRSQSIKLHSKLQALKEEKRSSFHKAVNTILKAKDKFTGVYGTISQLGETEAEYQTALEVAAGSRLHNVVVESTETAKECIQYLKDVKAGRATFLPLDRMRKRKYPPVKKEGVIDYAVNLVRFDPQFRPAFENVFSDTLVVKDLEVDLKGKRLVTLEGDIFERGGAITGGHYFKRKYSSAFTLSEDKEKFKQLQKELEYLKQQKTKLDDQLHTIEPKMQKVYDKNLKLKERIPSLNKELTRLKKESEDVLSHMKEKEYKKEEIVQKIQKKNDKLSYCTNKITDLESDIKTLETEKEEISKPLKQDELERIETELESLRENLSAVESEIVQTESRQKYLKDDIQDIENTITKTNPEIAEIEEKISEKEQEKSKFDHKLEEKQKEEKGFDEKIRDLRKQRDAIREDMSTLRGEKEVLQKKVYKAESSLNLLKNKKEQLQEKIDELQDLSSQYPVEGEYEDIKELKFKIKKMEREKELLEPINMRAVEEFEDVQLRYNELKTRIDKLYEERKSILEFIEEVESQKKSVFFEAYYNVAENFSRIFAELSPGGSGSLSLENEKDPFEGGLEIEASPKGKELKRVEAMSGGEKALTALAFVFAVQQYKPAPFYFFDEIDAHLDDENATRVAELIKRASEDTQFIVITLRDVMMAAADVLYGVSMKEQVSKIVSVELEKIAEYTEPQEDELMVM